MSFSVNALCSMGGLGFQLLVFPAKIHAQKKKAGPEDRPSDLTDVTEV